MGYSLFLMNEINDRRILMVRFLWTILAFLGTALTTIFATALSVVTNRGTDWYELVDVRELKTRPKRLALHYSQTQGWQTSRMVETVYAQLENGYPVVYSSSCTHLGCAVHWEETLGQFQCPCHKGTFDLQGQVISGPPSQPLKRLPVKISNNKVRVQRA